MVMEAVGGVVLEPTAGAHPMQHIPETDAVYLHARAPGQASG
jgi:hypothetical protein